MHAFVNAVEVAATVILPLNLNSTVKLLRELGYSNEADAVIEKYVQLNAGSPGVFKIDDSPWNRDVDDETLKRRFSEVLTAQECDLDLASAATILIEDKRWSDRLERALLKASTDDLVSLLKQHQGDTLRVLIDQLYRAATRRVDEAPTSRYRDRCARSDFEGVEAQ